MSWIRRRPQQYGYSTPRGGLRSRGKAWWIIDRPVVYSEDIIVTVDRKLEKYLNVLLVTEFRSEAVVA